VHIKDKLSKGSNPPGPGTSGSGGTGTGRPPQNKTPYNDEPSTGNCLKCVAAVIKSMQEDKTTTSSQLPWLNPNEGLIGSGNAYIQQHTGVTLGKGFGPQLLSQKIPEGYYVIYTDLRQGGAGAGHVLMGYSNGQVLFPYDPQTSGGLSPTEPIKAFPIIFPKPPGSN
ncbi:MAG: hypothetical protein L0Y56_22550, partial [Nitrospira sp.]|nr:hypothetical protein [Nitrospira sp.]